MSQLGKRPRFHRKEETLGTKEETEQFEQLLLGEYDYAFPRGGITKGTILSIEGPGAMVDIGAKVSAFLPSKEMANPNAADGELLEVGKSYEFFILRDANDDNVFTLSHRRVFSAQNWKKLEDLMQSDTVVEGVVTSIVKGGVLVEVMGLRGFVPSSHLRVRDSLENLINQKLPLKILTLDQAGNNIIMSHRKVVSEQMAEQRKELFSNIEEGGIIEGEVVRLTDFGAFIDLGGVDGLLPLSQMSWRWVEHPSDILKIGDKVKVEVIGIDHDRQRVSLSIKSQFNDPWVEIGKEMKQGDEAEGTITRLKHFGAFVEIYPGVEALLPSKDIMAYENANNTKLDVSQTITTQIVKFNPEERRISLSLAPMNAGNKPAQEDPQESMQEDLPEEQSVS
ncbi:MAG: S1 RNA-binding domain-containing protein [Vampirovibrio sp.]|nr:S1 RNA-binding domain-containing protein [Vampirovibrio sp.]